MGEEGGREGRCQESLADPWDTVFHLSQIKKNVKDLMSWLLRGVRLQSVTKMERPWTFSLGSVSTGKDSSGLWVPPRLIFCWFSSLGWCWYKKHVPCAPCKISSLSVTQICSRVVTKESAQNGPILFDFSRDNRAKPLSHAVEAWVEEGTLTSSCPQPEPKSTPTPQAPQNQRTGT